MTVPFRERVYTGNWPDAGLLNTLLEKEDIQTFVAECAEARRSGRQEIYVLNEAQIERAREIAARFIAGEPLVDPKTHKSWRCRGCNELVEGQFDSCWKCGAARV
jgi:hypothetical protein